MDHDEQLIWSIRRPEGLNRESWQAISQAVDRLDAARKQEDIPATVGAAKELCESVARVVLAQRGGNIGYDVSYELVINEAHKALDRQPGRGLANDPEVRKLAQSAKTMACELGPMRNQRGTGHGRAVPPDVAVEHGLIACDAACLWCRWALRRLGPYILGDVSALVDDLQQGVTFYRGDLAQRLVAVDVQRLRDGQPHLLGTAVGRRAVGGTFLVQDEGVDAASSDPDGWPRSYRTG